MTPSALSFPATTGSPYQPWHHHFLQNRDTQLPWHDPYHLTPTERHPAAPPIQQFQLGEYARSRGLKRRPPSHPARATDPAFLPALDLFIAEEQHHSAILGRFLDHETIPRLTNNWLDAIFRRLRKLAGLDVCVTVLVTAELLAMPFYEALRDATRSPLLRAICLRILRDEAAHLKYQALTLGLLRRPLSHTARTICSLAHAALFHGTALLLWQQHRKVFHAAKWTFPRFWNDAHRWFTLLQ